MKTPEEIKKDIIDCLEEAIEVGNTGDAHDLLVFSDKAYVCIVTARAYIHDLETDKSRLNDTIRSLTELLNAAHEETEKVKRERDAAVRDLNLTTPCNVCMNNKGCPGWPRFNPCQWQWRGICPENTEVRTDGRDKTD